MTGELNQKGPSGVREVGCDSSGPIPDWSVSLGYSRTMSVLVCRFVCLFVLAPIKFSQMN